MPLDRLQTQRFELKYLVRDDTAKKVRQFLRCYLKPDEFAAHLPEYSYPVHSLYLDSPDLATYQAVQTGEKNRFKLRIRYYSEQDKTVYCEIKRRTNDCISKMRAKVHRWAIAELLAGRPPQMRHLASPDPRHFTALVEFCRLMHRLEASPRSHVAYRREAWMSPIDNSLRITFDRQVQCEPEFSHGLHTAFGESVLPFDDKVVLELKFVDRLPEWCREMIRAFGLVRGGAPKYAQGVLLLGEHRVSNHGIGLRLPAAVGPREPAAVREPAIAIA